MSPVSSKTRAVEVWHQREDRKLSGIYYGTPDYYVQAPEVGSSPGSALLLCRKAVLGERKRESDGWTGPSRARARFGRRFFFLSLFFLSAGFGGVCSVCGARRELETAHALVAVAERVSAQGEAGEGRDCEREAQGGPRARGQCAADGDERGGADRERGDGRCRGARAVAVAAPLEQLLDALGRRVAPTCVFLVLFKVRARVFFFASLSSLGVEKSNQSPLSEMPIIRCVSTHLKRTTTRSQNETLACSVARDRLHPNNDDPKRNAVW